MSQLIRRRLRAGEEVTIRPIGPQDKDGLREGIERLGEQSRYRRFFSSATITGERELRYLSDVDHHDHEALLAIDPRSGEGIGVARFVRSRENPDTAEVAVAVSDEWQGRGLGTTLLLELAKRAREEGVRRFSASVLAGNDTMFEVLRRLGDAEVTGQDHGVIELLMDVPEEGIPEALAHAVRAAARGEISSR
jgi:RimJ/RimL family protein N-acetyltransferase